MATHAIRLCAARAVVRLAVDLMSTAAADSARTRTPDERKAFLARAVTMEVQRGWHVQSQTDYQAIIIRPGTKVNHILHLILTLLTLGIWALVWIILAITRKREQRAVLDVDQFGNVNRAMAWA